MHPRGWDDSVAVKRLGLNEKKILVTLRWYEQNAGVIPQPPLAEWYGRFFDKNNYARYREGEIPSIPRLMRDTKITSRPSISRTLKTLCDKDLVYPYGFDFSDKTQYDRLGWGEYTKYVTLTAAGKMIADMLIKEGFTLGSF